MIQSQQQQQQQQHTMTSNKAPEVIVIDDTSIDESSEDSYEFYIAGKPTTLPRPRFFQKGIWNSKKKEMVEFTKEVKELLPAAKNQVLFKDGVCISITMVFYLPRPTMDFVGGRRAPGNLKPSSLIKRFLPLHPDIDNLAKFVLDALNKVVYTDDKQIVKLVAYKLRHNDMSCCGGTRVVVAKFDPSQEISL